MLTRRIWHYVLVLSCLLGFDATDVRAVYQESEEPITDLVKGEDDELLVLSTLDGKLIGISRNTGKIKWKLNNEPAVKVPVNTKNAIVPLFLPDPKDGSLYLLKFGETNVLKRLPFSIQHLVSSSPCKSNDGIFYTGKKVDSWFSVDWKTGKKTSLLSFDTDEKTCPLSSSNALFIGRTEYSIMMYDSLRHNRHWNVTFYDYSARKLSAEDLLNYEYVHISGSSSGRVKTLHRKSGLVLWEKDFGSPLVALYMKQENDIIAVPFSSIADETFNSIPFHQHKDKLLLTLYIGEHKHGLYALPSLAGRDLPLLPVHGPPPRLLIEGPNATHHDNQIIVLGHYKIPDMSKTQLQITGRSDAVISINSTELNDTKQNHKKKDKSEPSHQHVQNVNNASVEFKLLCFFVACLAVILLVMFLYFRAKVRDIQLSSRGSSQGSTGYNEAVEMQVGIIKVGKISFNTQYILGKGCEGTFVFRGEFDGRRVAVKRLLPDCFTVADREVCLLRESDAHPNVIRYFCMEQDSQFRYIALELCSATVQDYVEKGLHKDEITPMKLLKQASLGLGHLHSLNIVHRDIKPHNILLSTNHASVRVMISDFGLCKKLQNGRMSFSRRSGITGTDGWIAPEMIESTGRTMCAVDIFSLGCVFYYVLSNGKHPFGESIRRQANILNGDYKLHGVDDEMWKMLIIKMISHEPVNRPSIEVVKSHPVFWEKSLVLTFLQDVSDRIEKEDMTSEVVMNLEMGAERAIGSDDWRNVIDLEVAADLRKYRSYKGNSVRDLLRAIRNKKHHYRELSEKAQNLLGSNSDSYLDYWTTHFPVLLDHTWISMQIVKEESAFQQYYHSSYSFPKVHKKLNQQTRAEETSEMFENKLKRYLEVGKCENVKPSDGRPRRENWMRTNKETLGTGGMWRGRTLRIRPKRKEKKQEEMESLVFKVPPI